MVFVQFDASSPTLWCDATKNELVPRFNCTSNAMCGGGLRFCGFDPSDVDSSNRTFGECYDEIGPQCTFSIYLYYIIFAVFFVALLATLRIVRCIYSSKCCLRSGIDKYHKLKQEFEAKLRVSKSNHYKLRLTPNLVPFLFNLFRVVQFVAALFYTTELLKSSLNGPIFVAVTCAFAPLISEVINQFKPDVDALVTEIKAVLDEDKLTDKMGNNGDSEDDAADDKTMIKIADKFLEKIDNYSREEILEIAYLVELDHGREDLYFPWKKTFLYWSSALAFVALVFPWICYAVEKGYLTTQVNNEIFWFNTLIAFFISCNIAVFMECGRLGMQVFSVNADGKLDIHQYYGSLSDFLNLAGYRCTIFHDIKKEQEEKNKQARKQERLRTDAGATGAGNQLTEMSSARH